MAFFPTTASATMMESLLTAVRGSPFSNFASLIDPGQKEIEILMDLARQVYRQDPGMGASLCSLSLQARGAKNTNHLKAAWTAYSELLAGRKGDDIETRFGVGPIQAGVGRFSAPFAPFALLQETGSLLRRRTTSQRRWLEEGMSIMGIYSPSDFFIHTAWQQINGTYLHFRPGDDPFFHIKVNPAKRWTRNHITITLPKDWVGEIERAQLQLLAARGFAMSILLWEDPQRTDLEGHDQFPPDQLDQPLPVGLILYQDRLVEELAKEIKASPYPDLAIFLPLEPKPREVYNAETLQNIMEKLMKRDPGLATYLHRFVMVAKTRQGPHEIKTVWLHFIRIFQALGGNEPVPQKLIKEIKEAKATTCSGRPGIAYPLLAKIGDLLSRNIPERAKWLEAGLQQMGVPDPEGLLAFHFFEKIQGVFLDFSVNKTSDTFQISSSMENENRRMVLHIKLPSGRKKSLTEEEMQLLVTRGMILALLEKPCSLPPKILHPLKQVKETELKTPIPLNLILWGEVLALSPILKSPAKRADFHRLHRWLSMGPLVSRLVRDTGNDQIARQYFRQFKTAMGFPKAMAIHDLFDIFGVSWRPLLAIPNAAKIFENTLSVLPQNRGWLLIQDETIENDRVTISYTNNQFGIGFIIEGNAQTLKKLEAKDLIGMISMIPEMRKRPSEGRKVTLSLTALRDPESKSDAEFRITRSYLQLLWQYQIALKENVSKILISGPVEESVRGKLARTLSAIHHFLRKDPSAEEEARLIWGDLIKPSTWYLQESGVESDTPIVELIPTDKIILVQIHGSARAIAPLDWLFLLATMAANPGQAIKVDVKERTIIVARETKQAGLLYQSIAFNSAYEDFGVFDPNIKPPPHIDLALPGGVPAKANQNYGTAEAKKQGQYVNALRWFALAPIPDEWKPRATDSREALKKRFNAMQLAWHPDRNMATSHQIALLGISITYWDIVRTFSPHTEET